MSLVLEMATKLKCTEASSRHYQCYVRLFGVNFKPGCKNYRKMAIKPLNPKENGSGNKQ